MNILILGGGGREHALAWAIRQNPKCDRLIVAPGNAGIAAVAECARLDICAPGPVAEFCAENAVDLVVIGPEAPLAAGVSDRLRLAGIAVFGPSREAAQLEASKAFAKEICDACAAPTAAWARFSEVEPALAYLRSQGAPIVVKADGLAAGKGVTVAQTLEEAEAAVRDVLGGAFGAAGAEVVIEAFMAGEEASFFVLCDGEAALPVGSAQDHKRVGEGDTGPNTGGMGAYSPAPVLTPAIEAQVMAEIIYPTLAAMAVRGTPFQGVLYAGLMIADGRARLVEYNVRFGDPEAQVLMMRLGAQALDLIQACAEGRLPEVAVQWADDHALSVVLAAEGYPGDHAKGSEISGLDGLTEDSHQVLFHAGTAERNGRILADGGRVLAATGRGATLAEAAARAYGLAGAVDWPEGFYRRDIGWRVLDGWAGPALPPLSPLAGWAGRLAPGAVVFATWNGGDPIEPGVVTMPFPDYHDLVSAFVQTAYDNGWVLPDFDWPGWAAQEDARRLAVDPAAVAEAGAADLFRLLTTIIRSERFRDGALLEALEAGIIDAVARRASVLARASPGA